MVSINFDDVPHPYAQCMWLVFTLLRFDGSKCFAAAKVAAQVGQLRTCQDVSMRSLRLLHQRIEVMPHLIFFISSPPFFSCPPAASHFKGKTGDWFESHQSGLTTIRCVDSKWFQSTLTMCRIHMLSACGWFSPFYDLTEASVLQQQKSRHRWGS